jgi:hypothetical protein
LLFAFAGKLIVIYDVFSELLSYNAKIHRNLTGQIIFENGAKCLCQPLTERKKKTEQTQPTEAEELKTTRKLVLL